MRQIKAFVFVLLFYSAASQPDSVFRAIYVDTVTDSQLPFFDMDSEPQESGGGQQDISGLLQGSRDPFLQFAAFQFGAGGFRVRGLPGDQHNVMVNGVDLSDPETGRSSWASWGGLNDATRLNEIRFGNTASRYLFPGTAGYTNITASAATFRRGTRISYSNSGRIFRHRAMLSHHTGLRRSGWAFSAALSFRKGSEVVIPGTYFTAASAFISLHRRISHRQNISTTFFAAPVEQGRQSASVLETVSLTGDVYYNSSWGKQNGITRNSRISRNFLPAGMITHTLRGNKNTKVVTTLCYQGGRTSLTGLNYADAENPRPDYYKNLPSYHSAEGDSARAVAVAEQWRDDPDQRQVDWDRMISQNSGNFYSLPSDSATVNTTETRARYILENNVQDNSLLIANSTAVVKRSNLVFSGGLTLKNYRSRKYKVAEDLLGATFWLDVDPFAPVNGTDDMIKQNDTDQPDRKVRTGEKFGYDYSVNVRRADTWAQVEYQGRRTDCFISGSGSFQEVWREGYTANGKFPHTSKGKSEVSQMPGAGIRCGYTYKISGRHYLYAGVSLISRPPAASNIFISPGLRNDLVTDLVPELHRAADLNYVLVFPGTRLRVTFYDISSRNQLWKRTFWHDGYNTTVNMIMRGVNVRFRGIETGVEKSLGRHSIQCAAAFAGASYEGRPVLEAWQDNSHVQIYRNRTVFINGYSAVSAPQTAAGAAYRYSGRRSWFVSVSCNYFGSLHTAINPEKRTAEATAKYTAGERDLAGILTAQELLPSWWSMNVSAFKSFTLKNRSLIGCGMHLTNLLNAVNIASGFEQLRWDAAKPQLFAPKYVYAPPRSLLFSLTYNL